MIKLTKEQAKQLHLAFIHHASKENLVSVLFREGYEASQEEWKKLETLTAMRDDCLKEAFGMTYEEIQILDVGNH